MFKDRSRHLAEFAAAVSLLSCLILTGCGSSSSSISGDSVQVPTLHGSIHGGRQPISGASIQLYAAGTTGYGAGATQLLGTPVTSDSTGGFSLTGNYTCASSNSLVYIVATGGNPGLSSGTNPAIALAAALGPCNHLGSSGYTLDPSSFINLNEVTTVAAVYSLAQFWHPNSFTVGTSSTNYTGLANAFTTAQTLADVSTGTAYTVTPPIGSAIVPQSRIYTLANILASCINTNGTDGNCTTLFSSVDPQNSIVPTDTISALLDIALSPATNPAALYALSPSTAPFQPTLSAAPTDFSLAIEMKSGGYQTSGGIYVSSGVAIDSQGNAWFAVLKGVTKLSPAGDFISPALGYTDGYLSATQAIAIDPLDNVWVPNIPGGVAKFTSNGSPLTTSGQYPLPANQYSIPINSQMVSIAIADSNNIWLIDRESIANTAGNNLGGVVHMNAAGTILNPLAYSQTDLTVPSTIALDSAGTIWVTNGATSSYASIAHFDGAGNLLSPTLISDGGFSGPVQMVTDRNRNLWTANYIYSNSVSEFDSSGNALSPSTGYSDTSFYGPQSIAVDGDGYVWFTSTYQNIVKLDANGQSLSGPAGYGDLQIVHHPAQMAIDASGNIWLAQINNATKFIGIAAPVVTPLNKGGSYGQRQ